MLFWQDAELETMRWHRVKNIFYSSSEQQKLRGCHHDIWYDPTVDYFWNEWQLDLKRDYLLLHSSFHDFSIIHYLVSLSSSVAIFGTKEKCWSNIFFGILKDHYVRQTKEKERERGGFEVMSSCFRYTSAIFTKEKWERKAAVIKKGERWTRALTVSSILPLSLHAL